MVIDKSIIESFIEFGTLDKVRNCWIYGTVLGSNDEIETPSTDLIDRINKVVNDLERQLREFKPIYPDKWKQTFGAGAELVDSQIVMLVIGLPEPFDALVRYNPEGKKVIVFDVVRILSYSDINHVISSLVTHEVVHIINEKVVNYDTDKMEDELKHLFFDEGFAHYLTINLKDNEDEVLKSYQESAWSELYKRVRRGINEVDFHEGNQGKYWSKFIPISSMFTINSLVEQGHNLKNIYSKGPEYLWNKWIKLVASGIHIV